MRGGSVNRLDIGLSVHIHMEIADSTIRQGVAPAMHGKRLFIAPSLLNDGSVANVSDLLDDVKLAEAVQLLGFIQPS